MATSTRTGPRRDGPRGADGAAQGHPRPEGGGGEDPYWGRIVSELGSAGTPFDIDRVLLAYGSTVVCAGGVGVPHDAAAVATHMAGRHVVLDCDLGLGSGEAVVLGTDLGYGYIDENRTTS